MAANPPVTRPHAPSTSDSLPHCTLGLALEIIVDIFHQYASRDGKDDFLSRKEMTELLKTQIPTFLAAYNRSRLGSVDELFRRLDIDDDNELSFDEALNLIILALEEIDRLNFGEGRCSPDNN